MPSKTLSSIFFSFILIVQAGLLTGCSSNQVSYDSGGMTHTFSEGSSAVPPDFPLPIYPQSKATGSVSAEGQPGTENSRFLMLSSQDSVGKVSDYYRQQLRERDWKISQVDSLGTEEVNISATNKDQEAGISISSDGKRTFINLQVSRISSIGPGAPVPQANQSTSNTPATD